MENLDFQASAAVSLLLLITITKCGKKNSSEIAVKLATVLLVTIMYRPKTTVIISNGILHALYFSKLQSKSEKSPNRFGHVHDGG